MTQLFLNSSFDYLILNSGSDWLLLDDGATDAYPATPLPLGISITSYSPTFVSVTHGLRRQARSRGGHAWMLDLRYGALTQAQFGPIWAFLAKQAGQAGAFSVAMPGLPNRGTGTAGAINGAGQTGTEIATDGWTPSASIFYAGDFLQIEGDQKVYQVTEDVTANGSGAALIPIFPALRQTPGDNMPITSSVVFRCALSRDELAVDWTHCLMPQAFSVSLVEIVG